MPDNEGSEHGNEQPNANLSAETIGIGGNHQPPRPPLNQDSDGQKGNPNQLEKDIRTGEKWLVGIGIASVAVNLLIAWIYFGQLQQMRKATEDTTQALRLAEDSSTTESSHFDRTMGQLITQTASEVKSSNAADSAAGTAAGQLELSELPWIRIVDVQTSDNPTIPALSFQNGAPYKSRPDIVMYQATLQMDVSLQNIGHSVAFVNIVPELIFPKWGSDTIEGDILREEHRYCDSMKTRRLDFGGKLVYPGDIPHIEHTAVWTYITPNSITEIQGQGAGIIPVVILCVNYKFSASRKMYQTRVVYDVLYRNRGPHIFPLGIGVRGDDLRLDRDELGDDAY